MINTSLPNAKKTSIRARFFHRLSKFPNILIIYKAIAMIMVWSGIWGLMDIFIFPDTPTLRYSLIFIIGIFLLYIDDGSVDELVGPTPRQDSEDFNSKIKSMAENKTESKSESEAES